MKRCARPPGRACRRRRPAVWRPGLKAPGYLHSANRCLPDVVEPRKLLQQPRVPALEVRILLARADAARAFAILRVGVVDELESRENLAERRERLLVVRRRVVPEVEEDLGRPAVRYRERERHSAAHV